MQKEKLAAIGLVIIIVVAVSAYFFLDEEFRNQIIENLFGKESVKETIELGDCADVHYIGRYASDNTIFDASYSDTENKTGGTAMQMFISTDPNETPSKEGYSGIIEGLAEGLVGLKKGATVTVGPIPPEKAYGVKPKAGDVISFSDPVEGTEVRLDVVEVIANVSMPEEYIPYFGNQSTTLYNLRVNYSIGAELQMYPSWRNATYVTKINETMVWTYTTPPLDKRENFTWIDNTTAQSEYWKNASSVTTLNDTTIVITHTPAIGATMDYFPDLYSVITYTVVNLTDDKVNCSYTDDTGNTSYTEFNRTITIKRNESQIATMPIPIDYMEQLLGYIALLDPDLEYSLDNLAGESLIFEVEIVEVYKKS
jgi:hypothetical protein